MSKDSMRQPDMKPAQSELDSRHVFITILGLMMGVLMSALDTSVIGTSMPSIIRSLSGMEHYSWPFTSYLLCSTVAVPIFGKIADSIGRRTIFLFGLAEFMAASALCGVSADMNQFIVFRGLQGLGAGVIISSAFAIVGEAFPPRLRGKYIGFIASMFGLASLVGPTVGGVITDGLGWRWAFYINLPVGALAVAVTIIGMMGRKEERRKLRVDIPGVILFIACVVPLMLALAWGGRESSWSSPLILGLLATAAAMLAAFIVLEHRVDDPLIPPFLFREREFSVSAAATFLTNMVFFGGILFLPLYLQEVMKTSAAGSGLAITPMMIAYTGASILGGQLAARSGRHRVLSIVSCLIAIGATLGLVFTPVAMGSLPVIFWMITLGIGLGLSIPLFNLAAQNCFEPKYIGTITATIQFFRNIGSAVGSALLGSLMINRMEAGIANLDFSRTPEAVRRALGGAETMSSPGRLREIAAHLPAEFQPQFRDAMNRVDAVMANAVHWVFAACAVIAALSLMTVWAYKKSGNMDSPNVGKP